MKVGYALLALVLAGTTSLALSPAMAAEEFQISPRVGKSTLRIDGAALKSNEPWEKDTFLTGVTLGYVTPFHVVVEGGYSNQGNWNVFGTEDRFELSEYTLAVGVQIETPRGFRIVPKVGRVRWDLYSKERLLRYPDVDRPDAIRRYDDFWEVTLQKKISESVALGVTYKDNRYDFGHVKKSFAFTASFGL